MKNIEQWHEYKLKDRKENSRIREYEILAHWIYSVFIKITL